MVGNTATTQGTWEYSTNGGANWNPIGEGGSAPSDSSALLLSPATLVRFVPAADFNGTAPTLTVRLIEDTAVAFTSGDVRNLTGLIGDPGSYSAGTIATDETIISVNDAPAGTDASFTFLEDGIESHTGRVLERYGLSLEDLFAGPESVLKRVVEEHLGADTAKSFVSTEETVNLQLDELREKLRSVDPTLADALETGRRKINYQLEGLRTRFHRAQMARDEAAQRQLLRAFEQLYPNKDLQERHINITSLLARHGRYVIEWIYNAINIGSDEHQIVYL